MSKRQLVPLSIGLVLVGALVALFALASGGSVTALAAGSLQAATPSPTATIEVIQPPATAVTNTASADPADDLTVASVDLHAGYIMDPYLVPVVGKTEVAASEMVTGCNGFVGDNPNVVVNWSGDADQLTFFTYSDGDAVLAIQQPDGSFVCNDDAGRRTVDPLLTIQNPAPGAYRVYTGSATRGKPALGFLAVTQAELDDAKLAELDLSPMLRRRERPRLQAIPKLDPRALLTGRTAIFGSSDLKAGFKPVQTFASGGGDIAAIRTEDQKLTCAGYVTAVPSYSFTWTGSPASVRLFFEALEDSALAVVTPDQKVLCGLNAAARNLNPVVDIESPAEGKYQVYIVAMKPSTVVGGRLTITGDNRATPTVLAPAGQ